MAIELAELRESRSVSGGSVTLNFRLTGTTDDVTAYNYLMDNTPGSYAGWVRERKPSIEPEHIDTITGTGSWKCSVRYVVPDQKEVTESEIDSIRIRGTTKGGTQHIITSLQTVGAYGLGAGTDNNGKLIGVTEDGVEGVDIIVPVFTFSVTKVFASDSLPDLDTLHSLTGKVNDDTFAITDTETNLSLSLDAGECLFQGVDFGAARADGGVEFVYEFAVSQNKTNLTVGTITILSKKGWEYMWVRHSQVELGGLKVLGQLPKAVYVEKVYEDGDFTGLDLAVTP